MRFLVLVLAGVLLLTAPPLPCGRAEEALLSDGRRLTGTLTFSSGRLTFTPAGNPTPLNLADTHAVRFPPHPTAPLLAGLVHQVELPHGQRLTGELLELDEQHLRLRTSWAAELSMPRTAVRALTQLPGQATFLAGDFQTHRKSWQTTGTPGLSRERSPSGQRCLLLDAPGQSVEHVLAEPLAAGQLGVSFQQTDAAGARWLLEAEFQGEGQEHTDQVTLAGDPAGCSAEVPGRKGVSHPIPLTPGWHRLQVEFGPTTLVVTLDDQSVWYSRQEGPGGALQRVRLACRAAGGETPQGTVALADFSLSRSVEELRHPPGDPDQDEVWLLSGDQVFGGVARAGRQGLELEGRPGKQSLPWAEVRGLFPRRQSVPPWTTEGEQVRLWFRGGAGRESDELEGTVVNLDPRRLTLHHPLLGDCDLDRARLQRLQWLFHGRRIELDSGSHHLGDRDSLVAGLQPVRGEGASLHWTFRLDAVPASARLAVQTVRLKGPGDGLAAALERGELRTEVLVNGQVVDYLNRQVERAQPEPRRLTLTLPGRVLRPGDNLLELRLTPERATGRVEDCGILDVAVEVPE